MQATLAVAREHGLEALTMRLVAERLGSGVMSLYRHVRDRDDLLIAMVDQVAAELTQPPVQEDPVEEVVGVFCAIYGAFRRDPWIVRLLIGGGFASPRILPLTERAASALKALGLADLECWRMLHILGHYAYGEALVMTAADRTSAAQLPEDVERLVRDTCPTLERLRRTALREATQAEEPFAGNLRILLMRFA